MAEIKVKEKVTYTYETSDGCEFETIDEANEWQKVLDTSNKITMLTYSMTNTNNVSDAYYVYVKDYEQVSAFRQLNDNEGCRATSIDAPGYWAYDEGIDDYVNIEEMIDHYNKILDALNS